MIHSLKHDNLSADEFDHVWRVWSKYRLAEIQKESTSSILHKWPHYKTSAGFRLVSINFYFYFISINFNKYEIYIICIIFFTNRYRFISNIGTYILMVC